MDQSSIREKWDLKHASAKNHGSEAQILSENLHLLPKSGKALDMACGRGANSILLARSGLEVDSWDISPVAINILMETTKEQGLNIQPEVRDLIQKPPLSDNYDVILVSHFLERDLVKPIISALKCGGLLFYQTFTRTRITGTGPGGDDMRLAEGELLELFSALRPVVYREEQSLGDLTKGWRDLAMLVAVK